MRNVRGHLGASPGGARPAAPEQLAAVDVAMGSAQDGARAGAVGRRPVRLVGGSLLALTKPRIIELLLVTTVPTTMLAARGLPAPGLLVVTLGGGALAAGSANAINCYLDRDIDAVMRRTSRRPLARPAELAVIRPREALAFGIGLGVAATLLLGLLVCWLAAALADAAIVFYIFVYTLGLKRRTASNIVIGGAAGGFPVLVGWAAVTGTVGPPSLILFAVIFFWTPPHFWALAMKFRDDYAAAAVPMLPVVAAAWAVTRKILIYSYAMVAATFALIPYAGWVYAAGTAGLGVWFLAEAHRLHHTVARLTEGAPLPNVPDQTTACVGVPHGACQELTRPSTNPAPMRLFHLSIAYLSMLFTLIAVTSLLPWGHM